MTGPPRLAWAGGLKIRVALELVELSFCDCRALSSADLCNLKRVKVREQDIVVFVKHNLGVKCHSIRRIASITNFRKENSGKSKRILEKVQGTNEKGQRDREPLRGKSASERVSEREDFQRFLEVLGDFQRSLKVFLKFSEVFRGFSEGFQRPSQRQILLSWALSGRFQSCCP